MPTIPLFKANVDLAMPQVPALDRERRPQIDDSNVLSAMSALGEASQRRGVDPGPFVEAAGAKGEAVGRGLSQVGNVMSGLAEKMVEAAGKERLYKQDQEIEQTRQQYAAKISTAPDPAQAFTDGTKALTKVAIENAAPVRTTPLLQAMIHGRRAERLEQSIGELAMLHDQRQLTLADEAMLIRQDTAFLNQDYDEVLRIGLDRDELNGEGMEHTLERVDVAKRNDLLTADPREYRRMMGLPLEEQPDFMRSIPEIDAPLQRDKVETAIAWKQAEVVGSISADINSGVLASSRELAFELPKYDPTGELSPDQVHALMRKFQGDAAADPHAYVKMRATVANFDHGVDGELGAAKLSSEIGLYQNGDYQSRLRSEYDKQVELTRGVGTMDAMQVAKAGIFRDIASKLDDGYFGDWGIRADALYEDKDRGVLMRPPYPGERGDQPVRLSESDKAVYANLIAKGGEALKSTMLEDQNLKNKAARSTMGMMHRLESSITSTKDLKPADLLAEYGEMTAPLLKEKARRMLEGGLDGYAGFPLSRITRLLADPKAAWDAVEKTFMQQIATSPTNAPDPKGAALDAGKSPAGSPSLLGDGVQKDTNTGSARETAGVSKDIFVPPSAQDISVVNGIYDQSATARLLFNESVKDGMTVQTTRPKGVETVTKTPGSLATIAGPLILAETISEGDRGDFVRSTAIFHESFHRLQQKYRADPKSVPEAVRLLIESVKYPGEVIEAADMEARRVQNIIIQEISSRNGKKYPLLKVYGNERMNPGTEIGKGFSAPENVPATTPPFRVTPKPSTEESRSDKPKR